MSPSDPGNWDMRQRVEPFQKRRRKGGWFHWVERGREMVEGSWKRGPVAQRIQTREPSEGQDVLGGGKSRGKGVEVRP